MDIHELHMPENHRDVLDRFIATCQKDERILAAFLGGSYANDKADKFSDLDFFFITTDEAYDEFLNEREKFVRLLGEPLFLEDFGVKHGILFILSNGTEGEVWFGSESSYKGIYWGATKTLVDKKRILNGEVFPMRPADPTRQVEMLRQQIDWFWHDLSHFIKAMGRNQLWFAYGELEVIRHVCVVLARLKYNFSDADAGKEPYFKIERFLPAEELVPLNGTCCPLEYHAMLQAGRDIFLYYQSVAPKLAKEHGIPYKVALEQMMRSQFEELDAGL